MMPLVLIGLVWAWTMLHPNPYADQTLGAGRRRRRRRRR